AQIKLQPCSSSLAAAVLLPLLLCSPARSSHQSGCLKVNDCKCIMKDGSGVINLKAMGDEDGFLGRRRPVAAGVGVEVLLTFSPCLRFTEPEDLPGGECTDVAACLLVRYRPQPRLDSQSRYINYGRHEGNQFHYNQTLSTLSVSYFALLHRPLTVVHFHCDPDLSSSVVKQQTLSSEEPLQVWVESRCACPNACSMMGDLGLGSIFLIILSLSAAAYFILGSCALRPSRSSGGVQISPEHSVWCMICYHCSEQRPQRRPPYTDMKSSPSL
uniref:Uncharacterized protein n=1 Tax=Salarias fasciatus TaxID=181472 RepID=A0A672HLF6_SALFA